MTNQKAAKILGRYDVSDLHFYTTDGEEIPFTEWSDAIEVAISALRAQDLQPTCNFATDCIWEQLSRVYNMDDVPDVAKSIIGDVMLGLDESSAQPEPCDSDESAKRLNDLISDINPWEICSQIESDNLSDWCKTIQTEMKMAMVQLP